MPLPLTGNFSVVLDACVLWPSSMRDTLLRLAETPRQYIPKWTDQLWQEVAKTLKSKRGLTEEQVSHLMSEVRSHFPEAYVTGYEKLIPLMTNAVADRHVTAAAVKCGAQVIVTFNLRHFPHASLIEWDLQAQHPDDFLLHQYYLNPGAATLKLQQQAANIERSLPSLLRTLSKGAPHFARIVAEALELDLA